MSENREQRKQQAKVEMRTYMKAIKEQFAIYALPDRERALCNLIQRYRNKVSPRLAAQFRVLIDVGDKAFIDTLKEELKKPSSFGAPKPDGHSWSATIVPFKTFPEAPK